jgi:hypothetical protein
MPTLATPRHVAIAKLKVRSVHLPKLEILKTGTKPVKIGRRRDLPYCGQTVLLEKSMST